MKYLTISSVWKTYPIDHLSKKKEKKDTKKKQTIKNKNKTKQFELNTSQVHMKHLFQT
jgi:hypothetical protein